MRKILIHNFSVRRGSFTLRPLSPTSGEGEIPAILGHTGSGKTVLLETIGGMLPGIGDSIQYGGVDVMDTPSHSRGLDFVYQDHDLFPHIRVCDNIPYDLKMHGFSKEEQGKCTSDLIETLSIIHAKNQYLSTPSGGESRRTMLARALALEPEVLLLDESFFALDPATRKQLYLGLTGIYEYFRHVIILITHDFVEARLLVYRVGILLNSELKAVALSDRLTGEHYCEEVERFLGRE